MTPDLKLYCAECGPINSRDEDGLCVGCGASTFRSDAEWFIKIIAEARAEQHELDCRAICRRCADAIRRRGEA